MKRRIAAFFALALLPAAAFADTGADTTIRPPAPDERHEITIPFEILPTGHITIQVRLNGKGPFRIIFDTGSPAILIGGTAAKAAGMIAKNAKPILLGNYTVAVSPATVQIGDYSASGLIPQVDDHPTVEDLAQMVGPLDGLAGFDLFSPDKLTLDYQARTLTFLPARHPKPYNKKDLENAILQAMDKKTEYAAPAALWGFSAAKPATDTDVGVTITAVQPGSAAAEAGLKVGDRLLTLSRRWTDSLADLYLAAANVPAGKIATLTLRRGTEELTLTATPRPGL